MPYDVTPAELFDDLKREQLAHQESRERIAELEAENKTLHRALAAKPDTATSSGASQTMMEYEIDLRKRTIQQLETELEAANAHIKTMQETQSGTEYKLIEQVKALREALDYAMDYMDSDQQHRVKTELWPELFKQE